MSKLIPSKIKDFFNSMRSPPVNVVLSAAKAVTTPVSVKPHVPMIKFRKAGGSSSKYMHSSQPVHGSPAASAAVQTKTPKSNATTSMPHIEDWQLPHRYRRRQLDQQEIDYINRGGPE